MRPSIYPVEGSGKNYCLAYITGTENFEITMFDTGYPDQTSGPQCLQGTKRCGEWSTSTSTTSTSVSTSTTTSTSTSAPPRYDPGLPELQDALNNLITSWEFEEGCGKTQGFEAESIAANIVANTAKKAKALAFLNEGVIRNYMTSGYYIRDQRLLFENYFGTEKVGAAPQERVCAEYNQTCTCNGLTRFQSVPATSWGTYRCHKSTFEKASVDIIFEPALSNKNMQCFCRADAEVQADYEVQKVARMFELAREVGATRRCDKMGAKLVTNTTKNRQTLFLGHSNGPGPQNKWNFEGPALNAGCAKKKGACGGKLKGSMSAYTVNLFNTTQPGLDCTRKNTKKALTCEKISFAKTEELERLFNEIFRNPALGTKRENKALVDQERETNYNTEYASKAGLDSTNLQLQENRNFKTNYEVANAALLQAKKGACEQQPVVLVFMRPCVCVRRVCNSGRLVLVCCRALAHAILPGAGSRHLVCKLHVFFVLCVVAVFMLLTCCPLVRLFLSQCSQCRRTGFEIRNARRGRKLCSRDARRLPH